MKFYPAALALLLALVINSAAQIWGPEPTRLEKKTYALFNNIPAAIEFLTKAIENGEDLATAYELRSGVYVRAKEYDKAIADLNSAAAIKPDYAYLYFRRADIRSLYQNDFENALKDLELAEHYGYNKETVMLSRAGLLADSKDIKGAIAEYRKLISLKPDSVDGGMRLSQLIFETGDKKKAVEELREFLDDLVKRKRKLPKVIGESIRKAPAVSKGEKHPVISNNVVSHSAGTAKELERQKNEMELARDFADALVFLALMQIKQGEFDKALADLDQALEVDRNNYNAFGLKGKIYLEKRDYKKAVDNLSEAIHRANVPLLYIDRGVTYLLMGKDQEAQKDFKKVLLLCSDCKAELDFRIAAAKKLIK